MTSERRVRSPSNANIRCPCCGCRASPVTTVLYFTLKLLSGVLTPPGMLGRFLLWLEHGARLRPTQHPDLWVLSVSTVKRSEAISYRFVNSSCCLSQTNWKFSSHATPRQQWGFEKCLCWLPVRFVRLWTRRCSRVAVEFREEPSFGMQLSWTKFPSRFSFIRSRKTSSHFFFITVVEAVSLR